MRLIRRDIQRLVKVRHKEIVPPFQLLYAEWIKENAYFKDLGVKLVCVTNRLLYPDKPDLISTAWVALVNEEVVAEGDFILLVPIEYTYPFIVEICRSLIIMIIIDYVLIRFPNTILEIDITIGLDCQSALDNLWNILLIVT